MIYLNILYFLIITYYGYRFLKSNGTIVKDPFDKNGRILLNGPEMFWVLTFSTGLLAFSAPLPIDLMAVRLMVIMVLCFIGFGIVKQKPIWSPALKLYVVYLAWLLIGCVYAPSAAYGIRVVLKYSYPLIFCLFASAAIDNFTVAYKSAITARWVALATLVISFIPIIDINLLPGTIWYATARTIHYITIMTFSIALFFFTNQKKKNLGFAVIFLFPCFKWIFRTSILGSGIAIMALALIKWRLKAMPAIIGILAAGVIAVFTIPSLHEKMFDANSQDMTIDDFQSGEVSMDNVNTNSRAAMWEYLEDRLFVKHELVGSGTGSVQNYMYNHFIFGGLKVPHSDFVQMRCDNGMIGFGLYCAIVLLVFLHCFKIYWSTSDPRIKLFAITAGASILGVFATCYSDNTVNYSMATLSMPFGFYGMALALNKRLKE